MAYTPLRLSFADLDLEIRSFITLAARDFLEESSLHVLEDYRQQLESLYRGAAKTRFVDWEIALQRPVVTLPTCDYDRAASQMVHAEMTGRAKIKRVGNDLVFDDVATIITIMSHTSHGITSIGSWHFDVGVVNGPGSFFHAKVEGEFDFPAEFPVPRLTGLPLIPVAALEYVIGELFQIRWPRHVDADRREVLDWRSVQSRRLFNYFNTLREHVLREERTPMVLLKAWKPEDEGLFGKAPYLKNITT